MRVEILDAPYTTESNMWQSAQFDLPDIEFIVEKARRYFRDPPAADKVMSQLELDGASHVAGWVDSRFHPHLRALRPSREPGDVTVQEVRSYGRGHVLNLPDTDADAPFRVAVKGAGVSGWARDNLAFLVRENQHRGVLAGAVPDEGGIKDIVGEYRVRATGADVPRTAFVVLSDRLYQIGRHWENPYRIWELTSGPFRIGPDVSQTIALLNWPTELRHALIFREKIVARARYALSLTTSTASDAQMVQAASDRVIDTLSRLAADDLGLSAWTFHLANISYSGESSGFDRVLDRAPEVGLFMLGILGGIIESWAAMNWLRAVLGLPLIPFDVWHETCVDRIKAHHAGCRFIRTLGRAKTRVRAYDGIEGQGAGFAYNGLAFVRRHDGDIAAYCDAIFTFQTGLSAVFSGQIASLDALAFWEAEVDIQTLEQVRIAQSLSGQHTHEQRDRYQSKLRDNLSLQQQFQPVYSQLETAGR